MTYEELRTSIEQWAENHDPEFVTQVDTCIRQAENRIVTTVRLPQFTTTSTVMAAANVPTTVLPTTFLAMDAVYISGSRPLLKKDPGFIYEAYQGGTGPPRFYGMWDSATILWGPTPDNNYTVNVQFFSVPTSICDVQAGTYLSTTFPAALLTGSLWQASVYMKSWDAAQIYEAMFKEAMGQGAKLTAGPFSKQSFESSSSAVNGTSELS